MDKNDVCNDMLGGLMLYGSKYDPRSVLKKQTGTFFAFEARDPHSLLACNRRSEDFPIMVNCSGCTYTPSSDRFHTVCREGRADYYLMYIVEGAVRFLFGETERIVSQGHVVILPPHYPWDYSNASSEFLHYYAIHFTGSEVVHLLHSYGLDDFPVVRNISYSNSIVSLFEGMWGSLLKKERFFEKSASLKLENILLHIARKSTQSQLIPQQFINSIRYMNDRFSEKITLEKLASLENLSVSRYGDLFKKLYGIAPIQYLISVRLKIACNLLKSTDFSVWRIAQMVGYAESPLFNRHFKRFIGISPLKYRYSDLNVLDEITETDI